MDIITFSMAEVVDRQYSDVQTKYVVRSLLRAYKVQIVTTAFRINKSLLKPSSVKG